MLRGFGLLMVLLIVNPMVLLLNEVGGSLRGLCILSAYGVAVNAQWCKY